MSENDVLKTLFLKKFNGECFDFGFGDFSRRHLFSL